MREELDIARKTEIQRIEDQKNAHIAELMKSHEKVFADIKNYYNDITHNNLDLIKSLKEEVAALRQKEQQEEKLMQETALENKRMAQPLDKALSDIERLKKELQNYNKVSRISILLMREPIHVFPRSLPPVPPVNYILFVG